MNYTILLNIVNTSVFGVIVGFILSEISHCIKNRNKKFKINILENKVGVELSTDGCFFKEIDKLDSKKDNPSSYKHRLKIHIYNQSNTVKFFNFPTYEFYYNKKKLPLNIKINDLRTKRCGNMTYSVDEFTSETIFPFLQEILELEFIIKDKDFIKDYGLIKPDKVVIYYFDEKGKKRKIKIKNIK